MSKNVTFQARPKHKVHCDAGDPKKPIVFGRDGLYTTDNPQEIAVLKKASIVSEVKLEEKEDDGAAPEKKGDKKDEKKAGKKDEKKKDDKEKNEDSDLHTITKEDLEANPKLAETYKVGDQVKVSDLV